MGAIPFDRDPLTGAEEFFHFDDETGGFRIQTREDVEPLIDLNRRLYNDGTNGWTPSRDLKRVAHIPASVILIWKESYGVDVFNRNHAPALKRLLNDPEWRHLRSAPGSL